MIVEKKKKGGKKGGRGGCKIISIIFAVLLPMLVFAQDDISQSGVIGNGRYLGAKTTDGQTIVPVLGVDSSGNTVVNALSSKSAIVSVAKTPVATFSTTGSSIPALNTTSETVAAAGSSVSDAAALAGGTTYVHFVTGADGTKGVKFVTSTPIGSVQFVLGQTAGVLKIYGESGSTCNGGSADAACTMTTGILPHICHKTAALTYKCT